MREAFKNQATAAIEKLKEAREDGFEEDTKPKTGGVLERARAAFPAGSRHDACSSFSSKVSLEYGGPDVGRIAVAAQVGTWQQAWFIYRLTHLVNENLPLN